MSYQKDYWDNKKQEFYKTAKERNKQDIQTDLPIKLEIYILALYGAYILSQIYKERDFEKSQKFNSFIPKILDHAHKKKLKLRWSGERQRFEIQTY